MKTKVIIAAALSFLILTPGAEASWLKKNVNKAGTWVSTQSGIGPAIDDGKAAANEAQKASAQADESLKLLTPKAEYALDSFNATWQYVSWSLVWVFGMIGLLLTAKVVKAWRELFMGPPNPPKPDHISGTAIGAST